MSKTKNLPAKQGETFALVAPTEELNLPEEIKNAMSDEDFDGFEDEGQSLPIVSIRQKPLLDDKGVHVAAPGGWKMYDSVSKEMGTTVADISGETGLLVNILMDRNSRTYWKEGQNERPVCQSFDALVGIGDPGGDCATCPLSQLRNGARSECTAEKNILVRDTVSDAIYVVRLGPSGLKAYRSLKNWIKRQQQTPMALLVRLKTLFMAEPQPHYVPEFHIEGVVKELPIFKRNQEIRTEAKGRFNATVKVVTNDESITQPQQTNNELPEGVTPIDPEQEELPY